MIKIIKKSEFQYLKYIESQYNNQKIQVHNLRIHQQKNEVFCFRFARKLKETKSVIFDIKPNIDGVDSYICVIDKRDNNLNGSLDIYIMNTEITISEIWRNYRDMPYMQTTFTSDKIVIDELHCDIDGHEYEGKRYGRMMVEAIKSIAIDSNRFKITGILSEIDAPTQEKKERRNNFYIRHGFILKFKDEAYKNGSFSINLTRE